MSYRFVGTYEHTIDDKGRLSIPAKIREALTPQANRTLVITRGYDKGCLFVYPLDQWEIILEKLRALPTTQKKIRAFVRELTYNAAEVMLDKLGRVNIPQRLLDLADVKKTVIIGGAVERIEIWSTDKFETYKEESEISFEELAEDILL